MNPYYQDDWLTVYHGDCQTVMAEMEPESVHCVVTSPPYWGLRDYGTATWTGGEAECGHLGAPRNQSDTSTLGIYADGTSRYKDGWKPELQTKQIAMGTPYRDTCGKCGATRIDSQLGLEPTPEEYVANLVAVFREVRRVLRADGTVWLNLGDSYNGPSSGRTRDDYDTTPLNLDDRTVKYQAGQGLLKAKSLKPKDLVGIPWRVAFALQADGWYLRSDIIWSKPNPMPESVTDRPTKSCETCLFLLSKSPRYYFDADAVREDGSSNSHGGSRPNPGSKSQQQGGVESNRLGVIEAPGRNIRSVWTIATAPYPGAHFATFPPKLVEPCIKAGCPADGVVLDPFAGSGTTGMVAQSLSRRAVLIDLSLDYLGQLMDRNADIPLGLGL